MCTQNSFSCQVADGELHIDQKKLEAVTKDVQQFQQLVKNRDLYLLFKSPIVHADKKKQILKSSLKAIDELFMAFSQYPGHSGDGRLYARNGLRIYAAVQAGRQAYLNGKKLTTASPLAEDLKQAIHDKLLGQQNDR